MTCTIVYNALSQDHPGVLKQQHASFGNGLHKGDVFHPNFQNGWPDIFIHSTTQPAFIFSSASCAGVAAATAGEV